MYITQKQIWDKNSKEYVKSVFEDKTGLFAYEDYINTPSLLSLFLDKAEYVLDLGCGDGRFTKILTSKYPSVTALDISPQIIKIAKKKAPKALFIQHDLDEPFPEFNKKFDLITAQLVLMYVNDLDNVALQCHKALKTGGSLIISVTHPLRWYLQSITEGNIDPLLQSYFSEIRITETIGGNKNTSYTFINRTLQTYVNTFTMNGFLLESLSEPIVSFPFLIKYPSYKENSKTPLRLNMKFINK
ncbi:class I SAM-dependent methyltransferase [Candidatus Dojkabacteria bacterium]|jgi:2-polyprenyl-3-methyl-5-hydroxy-6-metoxy-1,4-benzoquinol methylase|nr:class I SAM-dependent methyltransferase [Candidatus Dojkabacteria bacterium]